MRVNGIGAVVLAAGQSKRMGVPKMTLPWRDTTVIGQVVRVLKQAGIAEIVVVTGGGSDLVEAALKGEPVHLVFNPEFSEAEMLVSLQRGLKELKVDLEAFFVVLGDQPQIEVQVVRDLFSVWQAHHSPIVIPSFQMHRGHPWLVARELWDELLMMDQTQTMRDFISRHAGEIHYVNVETSSILKDLDTPLDYELESHSNQ